LSSSSFFLAAILSLAVTGRAAPVAGLAALAETGAAVPGLATVAPGFLAATPLVLATGA